MQERKAAPEDGAVSRFEIIRLYADNDLYGFELLISLSIRDWCEFSTQPFYHQLLDYLGNLEIKAE